MNIRTEIRKALQIFPTIIDGNTVRGHLIGYSDTETGLRHCSLPVGYITRDTGQFDIYAGRTRMIGDLGGSLTLLSKNITSTAGIVRFPKSSWMTFSLGNKSIAKEFSEVKVICLRKDVDTSQYSVIGPETFVEMSTGVIINPVPLDNLIESHMLLTTSHFDDNPLMDQFQLFMGLI